MRPQNKPHYFAADEVKPSVHGGGKLAAFTTALEAWRRGLSVTFLDPRPYGFEISDGEKTVRFDRGLPEATTQEAFKNCNHKGKTRMLLEEAGVSLPRGVEVNVKRDGVEAVVDAAHQLGYPLVMKPVMGSRGKGVFSGIRDEAQLRSYLPHITDELEKSRLVLEEHIEGEDYRVFVVGDQVSASTWRRPASVTGDGIRSIQQLISQKNRKRRRNPALSNERVTVDLEVEQRLSDQGYDLESIPDEGVHIRLRGKANLSTGGEIVDVTEQLTDSVKETAVAAVAAVPGLVAAGVDLMIDRVPDELGQAQHIAVIELNPRAHLSGHVFPSEGPGHNAAGAMVSHFFPETADFDAASTQRLSFDIDDVLAPLRQGVVAQSTVQELPEHHYPYRQVYTVSQVRGMSRKTRDRIVRYSWEWGVSGSLAPAEDGLELKVAGREQDATEFAHYVSRTLEAELLPAGHWDSVVWQGFKVTPSLYES